MRDFAKRERELDKDFGTQRERAGRERDRERLAKHGALLHLM